jgi:hypothetical protein
MSAPQCLRHEGLDPGNRHQLSTRATLACVIDAWEPTMAGVLRLPSGRLIRAGGLRRPLPAGPQPTFAALYLLGHQPPRVPWEARWLRWPDFRLPSDRVAAADALREAWARAETERVEIACAGGHGRTGTALACLAVLDTTRHTLWRHLSNAASSPASASALASSPSAPGASRQPARRQAQAGRFSRTSKMVPRPPELNIRGHTIPDKLQIGARLRAPASLRPRGAERIAVWLRSA